MIKTDPFASPLISVIIPVYNVAPYLSEAIDSVLAQTYQNFEIILVNDGSTDRSEDIILDYVTKHPAHIRSLSQPNQGAAAARNRGIAAAKGDWVAFLDGDDLWKPHKLERQMQEIRVYPQTNFVAARAEVYGKPRYFHTRRSNPLEFKFELLLHGCFITLPTVLIKKELVHEHGFDETLRGAHDLELYVRIADKTRRRLLDESLALIRMRQHSITDLRQNRHDQVVTRYRLVKREWRALQASSPSTLSRYRQEFQNARQRLSHEIAYAALFNPRLPVTTRLASVFTAIHENPRNLKNYRFFLQSFLPSMLNYQLMERRRKGVL
jgi:glycosyltransferase involved in cell wall biosynthesis